jgi:hypothetical protein
LAVVVDGQSVRTYLQCPFELGDGGIGHFPFELALKVADGVFPELLVQLMEGVTYLRGLFAVESGSFYVGESFVVIGADEQ